MRYNQSFKGITSGHVVGGQDSWMLPSCDSSNQCDSLLPVDLVQIKSNVYAAVQKLLTASDKLRASCDSLGKLFSRKCMAPW